MAITELAKPKDTWCPNCAIGQGCKIYDQRPSECRTFECGYLASETVPDHWYPANSKIVIVGELDGNRLAFHVDPGRPDAWRRQPFYDEIKNLAEQTADGSKQVLVCIGRRAIVILPGREVDLGTLSEDDRIVTYEAMGISGPEWHALKAHKDDPRLSGMEDGVPYTAPNRN